MAGSTRPNILWISYEDTNPFYGCYGDKVARTPNMDWLAGEGCRWTHAFSTAGVCAPSRCSVITGMYATSVGAHHMRTTHTNSIVPEGPTPYHAVLPANVKCFTEYLRAAGYFCTNNLKTDYQFDPPRTAWDEQGKHAHWRNRPRKDQPFFAVFNLTETHESMMWPENTPQITFDPKDMVVPPIFPDTPKVRESLARMYTRIEENDRVLARILKELDDDGLSGNTLVMNWSDHGPLPRGKRWPYDSGIHVPLIARWPGKIEAGKVSGDLVSMIDLGPTMLSVAGVEIPQHLQGQAFLGEQAAPTREYVFAARDRHDESYDRVRAVRDQRFKLIRNYHPEKPYALWVPYLNKHPIMQEVWDHHRRGELRGPQTLMMQPHRPVEELYDTQADPWETVNLAKDSRFAADLRRLRGALDGWLDEVGDMGEIPETEMVRRWYPDGKQPRTAPAVFVPIANENPEGQARLKGGTFRSPALLQLHCPTEGASIAYTFDDRDDAHWQLYTAPLTLPAGRHIIRVCCHRIGYRESEMRAAEFNITAG